MDPYGERKRVLLVQITLVIKQGCSPRPRPMMNLRQSAGRVIAVTALPEEGTHALDLLDQAEKVKADIRRMQQEVAQRKVDQLAKEDAAIDKWIQDLLFATPSSRNASSNTQLLKTVDQVAQALEDGRYSFEQVNKIFRKLSQNVRKKRINQGLEEQPLLQLLVEACGKMDCLDRNENSNKRWNGRVERALRRKVMALEWGIDLEDEPDG
ncbi:hypothetical protein MPSEU_000677700 [Mayamaea pseudoterrestris]|nr:hypothetical protein MPSEU_000677700 [Mayamaea pseudoterrestris]